MYSIRDENQWNHTKCKIQYSIYQCLPYLIFFKPYHTLQYHMSTQKPMGICNPRDDDFMSWQQRRSKEIHPSYTKPTFQMSHKQNPLILEPWNTGCLMTGSLSGNCLTPTQLLICSSFSGGNSHLLLICSSLSTSQLLHGLWNNSHITR